MGRSRLARQYLRGCQRLGLAEDHVVHGGPADVEAALLDEQEEIEFRLGTDYVERRDAE